MPPTHPHPEVLFTCGREPAYPRNSSILAMLQEAFEVRAVTSSSRRAPVRYASILSRLLALPEKDRMDVMFIGFLGQPFFPAVGALWKKPILFDAFISLYDTICFDRQWASPGSPLGRLAFWLDKTSCAMSDLVILDTQAHADYFHHQFGVPQEKLRVLLVGCDETIFYPRPLPSAPADTILFYGSYLPLHGVDTIIRAAALLKDMPYRFRLIGEGLQKKNILAMTREADLKNIEFSPSVPLRQLPEEISSAALCLGGPFGPSEKASRVISGKTYQCIAMGKPTIVGDSPASRELLTHGHDAWFCPMNDPAALASAIRFLMEHAEVRSQLGENAHRTFMANASTPVLKAQIKAMIEELNARP